jgi:pimeloyl-ACP methyl ester carboxylesterase
MIGIDRIPEEALPESAGRAGLLRASDVRGLHRLVNDATISITDLVEAVHSVIEGSVGIIAGRPSTARTRGITGLVYRSVRGVTRLTGRAIDAVLRPLDALAASSASSDAREAFLAALNGVVGDHLEKSGNGLAIDMAFRVAGRAIELSRPVLAAAFPEGARHLVVLVHGLCMSDLQWRRNGHDHGQALARDLGCVPVYLHYNSGRHISYNGRDFADRLDALVKNWHGPLDRLTIVGHSMGGLVARSACHYAELADQSWLRRLDDLVFLGTPHLGAPLERIGTLADALIGVSRFSAPFARIGLTRSAGIKDLGHACLIDAHWQCVGRAPRNAVALPSGVKCHALAASRQAHAGRTGARVRGDGLVPVDSALGRHDDPARDLALPANRCWIGYRMGHLDLLDRADAYRRIRRALAPRTAGVERRSPSPPQRQR